MIDELTIYNLAIKYPNTVDLVREVEKMTIDEFVEKADAEIYQDFNRTDVGEYTIADVALTIRRVAEQLKEKNE